MEGNVEESAERREEALKIYRLVVEDDTRPDDDITLEDFDAIVTYASR